ncbi:MAG: Ig-like domain-containing protein [Cyclobacteriaceae bacterium]
MNTTTILRSVAALAAAAILLSSCDVTHSDVVNQPGTTLTAKSVYMTPNSSGIIDLQSMVKTTEPVTFKVTSQPVKGSLQPYGKSLLKYTLADSSYVGEDKFVFTITGSNNVILGTDTLGIIVKSDTTNMPCTMLAQNDFFYEITKDTVIDVLSNDFFCKVDRSQLKVTIASVEMNGSPVFLPYYGTATVLANGNVKYVPGGQYQGADKFVYMVEKPENVPNQGDPKVTTLGFVYLTGGSSCSKNMRLHDDVFTFDVNPAGLSDTTWFFLPVTANDSMCTRALNDYRYSLMKFPAGTLKLVSGYDYYYQLPVGVTFPYTDTFQYEVCIDGTCQNETVTINFQAGNAPCTNPPAAVDDQFVLSKDSVSVGGYLLPVLLNDVICPDQKALATVTVATNTTHGVLSSSGLDFLYQPSDTTTAVSDSFKYKLCVGANCSTGKVDIILK